jgi:hypothetical protein
MEVQRKQKPKFNSSPTTQPGGITTTPSPEAIKADARRAKSFQQVGIAKDYVVPATLSEIVGKQYMDAMSAKEYIRVIMYGAGDPKDPIERMLLEQFVMLHHHIAVMHTAAMASKSPNAIKVNYSMLARLAGESRRLALALKTYRQPVTQKSFSVVKQQNLVANGDQTVTYVSGSKKKKETLTAKSKLNRNGPGYIDKRINGDGNLNQKPQSGGSRPKELSTERTLVR